MSGINDTMRIEIEDHSSDIRRIFLDTFAGLASEPGIDGFEKMLGIAADPANEPFEFRRNRVIMVLSTRIPFTEVFAKQKLELFFGEDNTLFKVDYDSYIVEIDIISSVPGVFDETIDYFRDVIPANMRILVATIYPYTHRYLQRLYTHAKMEGLTFGELSANA
jgi:hypothetical protein